MLKNFYKQYLSNNPDISVDENTKTLLRMSKGFLIVGALTSMSFTIPTIYTLLMPIFIQEISIGLTILFSFLLFFIIDLSIGSLTPFTLDYTFSKKYNQNYNSISACILLWIIIIFLGFTSMYLTFNGAKIPVISSIELPMNEEIISLEERKSQAIKEDEKRYKEIISKLDNENSTKIKNIQKEYHNKIKKETKQSRKDRLIQDSLTKVSKITPNTEVYVKQMTESINKTTISWDEIINQKKQEYDKNIEYYNDRISATLLIFQILGVVSTVLFFIIQLVVVLLKYGEKKPKMEEYRQKYRRDD
jgi:hypothetical protein